MPPVGLRKCFKINALLMLVVAALVQAIVAAPLPQGWSGVQRGLVGKDLNAVYFADSKRGWIAGDGGFVSFTKDGGETWRTQKVDTADPINDIFFRSKEDGYLLSGSRIFVTEDGGESWSEARRFAGTDFDGQTELYSVRFANKKKGWVVGSISRRNQIVDSLVLHTEDGGVSWLRQRVPVKEELIHLDFTSDERGWVVGAAGTILHTTDSGKTWTSQNSGVRATLYNVDFRDNEKGWAVGERGHILRTGDGGETWDVVNAPVSSTLLSVKFISSEDGWVVGRGGAILRTGDAGRTWIIQESSTRQNLYALYMDKKGGWAVGGDGLVLRYEL